MVVMVVGRRQERPLRSEGGEGSERLTCEAVKKKRKEKIVMPVRFVFGCVRRNGVCR